MTERKEYIIVENTQRNGWCLFRLAGCDRLKAEQLLIECKQNYPHKELKIKETEQQNCWWNDPVMVK